MTIKQLFLTLGLLVIIPFLTYSQSKDKITWVGQNNEFLSITKRKAYLQKRDAQREMDVVQYVKNKYFIFSQKRHGEEFQQKYNIVHFTKDTLILVPEGDDILVLAEPNEKNQYLFVNGRMPTYNFVELYYEISFNNFNNPKEKLKFILYIDSAKNSRVVIQNISYPETTMYTAPPSKVEYNWLLYFLSRCDLRGIPNEARITDKEFPYEYLEIHYNDQVKTFRGVSRLPFHFADQLADFISEYIESRANITARWGWKIFIRRQK